MRSSHRACGKTILLGEHWVVYGTTALAVPIESIETVVDVLPGQTGFHLDVSAVHRATAERVYSTALEGLQIADMAADWAVHVQSSIPVGEGMGSSAAFGCALIQALAKATHQRLSFESLWERVLELETVVHGAPSGLDHTVITHGAPIAFYGPQKYDVLHWPTDCSLLLASSGQPGSTRQAVENVAQWRKDNLDHFEQLQRTMSDVIEVGVDSFQRGELQALGQAMNESHTALQTLGVSLPILDRLVQCALDAGAWGAKLTGAGLGGAVLALVPKPCITQVTEAFQRAGAARVISVRQEQQ